MDNVKETTLTPEQQKARAEASARNEPAANTPHTREEKQAANQIDLQSRTDVEQSTATEDGKKAQIERELKAQADLSKANEEGHAANLKRIEEAHKDNKAADAGDGEERKVPEKPTSGLEHNRNTPRVDKSGAKHWD
jgi:hypothetical protein